VSETLLQNHHGHRPRIAYDMTLGGPLAGIDLAAETGVLLAATTFGQLMFVSRHGDPIHMELGFEGADRVVYCDSGQYAAVVRNECELQFLNTRLKSLWTAKITGSITAVGIAPHGSHLAIGTDACRIHVVNADRSELCRIDTGRPIDFIAFLQNRPAFIAAAEFGNMYSFDVHGTELWHEKMINNAGDLSVSPDGHRILMAAFNHGVQLLDKRGHHLGSFRVDGIPSRASMSANKTRIAVITLEHRLIWLNLDGNVIWAADLSSDPPEYVCAGPLGDRMFVGTQSGRLLHLEW
jgi:hypothetical protein